MADRFTQLVLVNMLLATGFVTIVFGAPAVPAIMGALGGGAVLLFMHSRRARKP